MKNTIKKIFQLRQAVLFTLMIALLSGAANYSVAGGQKPVKTRKKNDQKVIIIPNSTVPKPVFDDKPINPKTPRKETGTQQNNVTPPRQDTLPGNTKKRNQ